MRITIEFLRTDIEELILEVMKQRGIVLPTGEEIQWAGPNAGPPDGVMATARASVSDAPIPEPVKSTYPYAPGSALASAPAPVGLSSQERALFPDPGAVEGLMAAVQREVGERDGTIYPGETAQRTQEVQGPDDFRPTSGFRRGFGR
jgi:hypothetical protein